jgi:two-component system, OmpR family, sensor kinase
VKLSTRLGVGLTAVVVAFAVTGYAIAATQRHYLTEQVDRQLESAVPFASRLLGGPPGGPSLPPGQDVDQGPGSNGSLGGPPPDFGDAGSLSALYVGHLDVDGVLTPVVPGELVTGQPDVGLDDTTRVIDGDATPFTADGIDTSDRFRVMIVNRPDHVGWDVIALSLAHADAAYQRLLIATGIGALAVFAVVAVIALWVLKLGVKPINEMTAAADAITAGDVRRRIPDYPAGTEAGRLAVALNTMLDGREADEAKLRQFVADASHELRTPLTSIRGYTDLYAQGGFRDQAALDDALRRVSSEAARMGSLVDQLLLLSQNSDQTDDELNGLVVDLAGPLDDAVADALAVQPMRSITLSTDRPLLVHGNDHRLRQVIGALVHNALMHTPVETSIELSGRHASGEVVIEVADHGPGIDPELAGQVFERFVRGDRSRSRHTGGSGLGLAIADTIVRAHGGTISLDTAVAAGCRFTVRLPAVPEGATEISSVQTASD